MQKQLINKRGPFQCQRQFEFSAINLFSVTGKINNEVQVFPSPQVFMASTFILVHSI